MLGLDNKEEQTLSEQEKIIFLFEFIRELNKLKQKVVVNVKDYNWSLSISDIPDFPEYIHVFYRDKVKKDEDVEIEEDDLLLSVRKPDFQECPSPDKIFVDWLLSGWEDYRKKPEVMLKREKNIEKSVSSDENVKEDVKIEKFTDVTKRVEAYQRWCGLRDKWVDRQKLIYRTRELFMTLYKFYFEFQRDSETQEIVVANGILQDANNPDISHPVLIHRVQLQYDGKKNVISIHDTESLPELYLELFQLIEGINLDAIYSLNKELILHEYHPLDRNDTPDFLKILIHSLSSDSVFSAEKVSGQRKDKNRFLLYLNPCYIVRKRVDGTPKAIEKIIENIRDTDYVPKPIVDIVCGGKINLPDDTGEESIERQLAAVGGESVDVLLSKEANKEQLEIAQRIERYNAVLVQGPPGTGKTHTIANLMGHFLAQGKSVLVTSYTPKALSVLQDKVGEELKSLCVPVLGGSHVDVERSIDGITSYMAKTTSSELQREMNSLDRERKEIINHLGKIRRKIFTALNKECNSIVYNGEDISPSEAAKFIAEHADDLSYIPGKVIPHESLPLTYEQLVKLYRSNQLLSEEDEKELCVDLPNPNEVMFPLEFESVQKKKQSIYDRLKQIEEKHGWVIDDCSIKNVIKIQGRNGNFIIPYPNKSDLQGLSSYVQSVPDIAPWMIAAVVDGKNGGDYRNRWDILINQIEKTCRYTDSLVGEQFGVSIVFKESKCTDKLKIAIEQLKEVIRDNGEISFFTRLFHSDYLTVQESVEINGRKIQSREDCDLAIHAIEQNEIRQKCALYWNALFEAHGVPLFFDLDASSPERIARNWIPEIRKYLDWYYKDYSELLKKMEAIGFPVEQVFSFNALDSDLNVISKILDAVRKTIPDLCEACSLIIELKEQEDNIGKTQNVLRIGKRRNSTLCTALLRAIKDGDFKKYSDTFTLLKETYEKHELQILRENMLKLLSPIAPQWADAIRNREGIHGQERVPDTILDAWKWKQLYFIVDEIIKEPFEKLQRDSLEFSKKYRFITEQYAAKCAWYHLLHRTEADIDMKQALQGWKQTIRRIGKGTGKKAPALKVKARELMSKCQEAVPCWIMPIRQALESLNPKINRFDVIIIDEASQADISALAVLYMGEKLIIVGDDKQVSPMAVGVDVDKISDLEKLYLDDKIPNAHLYDAKTSIYDIAATTFQPLMLREHFRCVPEIIGFSNMLSYDYKIKPLRDASSSVILPAVVNYRVEDGERIGSDKKNPKEAETIVALMKACIEQDEYADKTFGVISLLGDDQAKIIQSKIEKLIPAEEVMRREILCGNSANFQGDERDVIFLSLVDSSDRNGPLSMMGNGVDDSTRKRYNVAVSRAKDQLWVVHSLDAMNDLKPGDMRKRLIDYVTNPQAIEIMHGQIEKIAESPFEVEVAKNLVDKGYHIVQQWKVGAYRLDMVAIYGKKKVAIECDGERWHSGEGKVREDMERQTILERLGWRFIRIRGSEYYRNSEETMKRVISELLNYGIEPENNINVEEDRGRISDLLNRVKLRAAQILASEFDEKELFDMEDINVSHKLNITETKPRESIKFTPIKGVIKISERKKE